MSARPNILLITSDQHRWDFYDNRTVGALRTPALSRLMREGATLPNAFTNCPICMPTRFTWCYGLYASQAAAGLLRNAHDWPTHLPSMPQRLQEAGYRTALVGKLHSHAGLYHVDLRRADHVEETRRRGFEHVFETCGKSLSFWYDCNWTAHLRDRGRLAAYRDDLMPRLGVGAPPEEEGRPSRLPAEDSMDAFIGRHAAAWLEGYDEDAPFFLHASFCGPHFPIDPPPEFAARHEAEAMPPPEGEEDPAAIAAGKRIRASYCGLVEWLDAQVGVVLDALERKGLAENTLVLYGTDHGDMLGHRGAYGKGKPFDTSTRTPYLVRWPGRIPAGTVRDDLVEAVDLPCTLLRAAGLDAPLGELLPGTPGRSFLGDLTGETPSPREWAYSELGDGASGWRMCREKRWKYVWSEQGETLHDLEADPWELHDRIDDPACRDARDRLRGKLLASMSRAVAPTTVPCPPGDPWWLRARETQQHEETE